MTISILYTGHKAFLAVIYVESTQNNPIALAFIEILSRGLGEQHIAWMNSLQSPLHAAEEGESVVKESKVGKQS